MNPVLFEIPTADGPLSIYAYGVSLALGVLAAWYLYVGVGAGSSRARARAFLLALGTGMSVAFLIAAATRIPAVLEGWAGFVPGMLAGAWYIRRAGLTLQSQLPRAAAAVLGGFSMAHLGGWLGGLPFGKVWASAPVAWSSLLQYPRWPQDNGPPALAWQMSEALVPLDAVATLPCHPVGLYGFVICFTGLMVGLKRPNVAVTALATVAVLEMLLAGLRADAGASLTQLFAVASALAIFVAISRRQDPPAAPHSRPSGNPH